MKESGMRSIFKSDPNQSKCKHILSAWDCICIGISFSIHESYRYSKISVRPKCNRQCNVERDRGHEMIAETFTRLTHEYLMVRPGAQSLPPPPIPLSSSQSKTFNCNFLGVRVRACGGGSFQPITSLTLVILATNDFASSLIYIT
jgi:hypothetical protein